MKFLIIGGNGFIGSHISDILLEKGMSVRVMDNSPEKYRSQKANVDYIFSSFSNYFVLEEALTEIDCVIHAASSSIPSSSNLFPIEDIKGNLINTVNLINTMRDKNVNKIIFLSSGGTVYGIPEYLPVDEKHITNPICSYGIVKLAIEKYLLMYKSLYNISPVILRISNPYGPRQSHRGQQGFIASLVSSYLDNNPLNIYGGGGTVRDFIYIKDVANAVFLSSISNFTGVFNIGSGKGISLNEIINEFEGLTNVTINKNYLAARAFDIPKIYLNSEKFIELTNWEPQIGIKEGLQHYMDWIDNQENKSK